MTMDSPNHDRDGRIDRRTLLTRGAIVTGGLAFGVGTATAKSEPQRYTVDLVGEKTEPPCRDEVLEIVRGKQRVTVKTFADGNGGVHLNFHSHFDPLVKAEGQDSGIVWTAQGPLNFEQAIRGPFPRTIHVTDHTTATADGSAETLIRHGQFHLTINGNGGISQFKSDVDWRCTGESTVGENV